jgi:hypothetical protein
MASINTRLFRWSVAALTAAPSLAAFDTAVYGQQTSTANTATTTDTPRTPSGVPDFRGIWAATPKRGENRPVGLNATTGDLDLTINSRAGAVELERDAGIQMRVFPREQRPLYKPQHWERVQFNDIHGHSARAPDPAFQCLPLGVPRMGMPQQIMQDERHMVFIYPLHLRRIYIDGRPHPPEELWVGTWFGHSIGRWDGDTLVISSVDFNGLEWLEWPGWLTTPDKRVIERMRRVGNTLTWEAEVQDSALLRPWRMAPQMRQLNTDPVAEIEEPLPCVERDLQHMVTRERG